VRLTPLFDFLVRTDLYSDLHNSLLNGEPSSRSWGGSADRLRRLGRHRVLCPRSRPASSVPSVRHRFGRNLVIFGQYIVFSGGTRYALNEIIHILTDTDKAYFQEIGGRMYPVDPELPIFLPHDEIEIRRLDHEHVALKLCLGGNYVGPVASYLQHDPQTPRKRVLDICTQQGSW
jgi:hypothetical protein